MKLSSYEQMLTIQQIVSLSHQISQKRSIQQGWVVRKTQGWASREPGVGS